MIDFVESMVEKYQPLLEVMTGASLGEVKVHSVSSFYAQRIAGLKKIFENAYINASLPQKIFSEALFHSFKQLFWLKHNYFFYFQHPGGIMCSYPSSIIVKENGLFQFLLTTSQHSLEEYELGVVHELGHQLMYKIAGNDSALFPELSEGFADFISLDEMIGVYEDAVREAAEKRRAHLLSPTDKSVYGVGYRFFREVFIGGGPDACFDIVKNPRVTIQDLLDPAAYVSRVLRNY